MKELLQDYFNRTGAKMLAGWYAEATLIQLDRLVLRIATPGPKGTGPTLSEVKGTVVRDTKRGQHVLFDNRGLVRISDGPRKGLIVRASVLRPEESGRLASWSGRPEQGHIRYQKLLAWFDALNTYAVPEKGLMPAPELLVSCQDVSGLHARLTGKAVQFLKPQAGETPDDALKRQWVKLSEEHYDRPGYRLLPLRHVTGRGGVYAKLLVRVSEKLNGQIFTFKEPGLVGGTDLVSADELCQIEVHV